MTREASRYGGIYSADPIAMTWTGLNGHSNDIVNMAGNRTSQFCGMLALVPFGHALRSLKDVF